MNIQSKEPWYAVTPSSSPTKSYWHWVMIITLGAGIGNSILPTWKVDPVSCALGILAACSLLFLIYQKGMTEGAASMYCYLTTRARDAANAIGLMDEIIRRKNDQCD